jgi:hypothetical protein
MMTVLNPPAAVKIFALQDENLRKKMSARIANVKAEY